MINRRYLPLLLALAACSEPAEAVTQRVDDAGAPTMRREAPWTPEEAECIVGSKSLGGDGFERGALYDEWSCDWQGQRRYLFTPCTSDAQCGEGGHCNTERGRCGARTSCSQTDAFQPNSFYPERWNCELDNGMHGVCLSTNNCIPLCRTDIDCPGVPCLPIGAYRLCEIL